MQVLNELLLETQYNDITSRLLLSENETLLNEGFADFVNVVKKMSADKILDISKKKFAQFKDKTKEVEQKLSEIGYNPEQVKEHVKLHFMKYFDKRRTNEPESFKRDLNTFVADMSKDVSKKQVIFDLDKINPVKAVSATKTYAIYLLSTFAILAFVQFLVSFFAIGATASAITWIIFGVVTDPFMQTVFNIKAVSSGDSKIFTSMSKFDLLIRNIMSFVLGAGPLTAIITFLFQKFALEKTTATTKEFIAAGEDPRENRNTFWLLRALIATVSTAVSSLVWL